MKRLVEVPLVNQAHTHAGTVLPVITKGNLGELYTSVFEGEGELSFFIAPEVPLPRLYKLVEEYSGPLTAYCTDIAGDTVFLSRFTDFEILGARPRTELSVPQAELDIKELKKQMKVAFV
jgi:hypothetical protein